MAARIGTTAVVVSCALMAGSVARAQGRGNANWTTTGYDAQRSSWVRTDPKISAESLAKPGFGFLWKIKLEDSPAYLNSLTPLIVLDPYTGYRGHKSLGYLSGSSGNIFGIDIDLGIVEWRRRIQAGVKRQGTDSLACPGGMTSPVARPTAVSIQAAPGARSGVVRSASAQSGVGEPLQGAINLATIAPPRVPANPIATPATAPPASPTVARPNGVYAVSGDGALQTLYVSNGADAEPPIKFLPPDSNVLGLIVVDNVVYAETSEGCGGRANAIWSLDLTSKQVNVFEWKTDVTEVWAWRHAGPAFGPDGTVYSTAGLTVAALEPKTLKPKNPITIAKQEFTSSPVVFRFDDKVLVAVTTRDGAIHLLDGGTMADVSRQSGPDKSDFIPGALASWQDTSGMRWILAPAGNAVVAWKVVNQNGAPALEPGWLSRDMVSPVTPIVVNGVVFALSSGEFRTNDQRVTAVERAQRSVPAILYALDAATGRELWNSGNTITSFVHSGGLSAGDSQIYLSTYDGMLYAFGFPMEH